MFLSRLVILLLMVRDGGPVGLRGKLVELGSPLMRFVRHSVFDPRNPHHSDQSACRDGAIPASYQAIPASYQSSKHNSQAITAGIDLPTACPFRSKPIRVWPQRCAPITYLSECI
jgi:hypothetical protein